MFRSSGSISRNTLCCKVLNAHPRYGVEGLWENVVARLVSSPSFLKFLPIRNMNDLVRSYDTYDSIQSKTVHLAVGPVRSGPISSSAQGL